MSNTEVEEDFLEVDNPINGQKYVLLSFVTPGKVLKRKELFAFHKYLKHKDENYDLTYEKFLEDYNNFMYSNQENIDSEFNELVDFQTSVRGLKVRGVYETYREAKVKAARLQKVDRTFHVFIGQVGYWLPWDPEPDNIEDQEYLNNELNTLVHEYKKNQEYKDEVFGKRVQDSKDDAAREVEKNRSQQAQIDAEDKKTATTEETVDALQGVDPWLASKLDTAETTSETTAETTTETTTETTATRVLEI